MELESLLRQGIRIELDAYLAADQSTLTFVYNAKDLTTISTVLKGRASGVGITEEGAREDLINNIKKLFDKEPVKEEVPANA